MTFADDSDIVNTHNWSLKQLLRRRLGQCAHRLLDRHGRVLLTFLLSKPIGALNQGRPTPRAAGRQHQLLRVAVILLSSVLTASVTAFAGPISFVGTAVPFLIKKVLHTAKPVNLIPTLFLGGAVFCMLCDLIARTAFARRSST